MCLNMDSKSLLQFGFGVLVLDGEPHHAASVLTLDRVENRQAQICHLNPTQVFPFPGIPIPSPHTQRTILNFLRAESLEI